MKDIQTILENAYKAEPDKEAIFDGYRRITYRELYSDVENLSSALAHLNITKGDRVMVCLPNWHEFVTITFSLAKIGAIIVPCNTRYKADELSYILENSRSKAVFLIDKNDHIEIFKNKVNNTIESKGLEQIFTVRCKSEGYRSLEELIELGREKFTPKIRIDSREDIFSILYTSGTTGNPKGVMLTHYNVLKTAQLTNVALESSKEDVFLIPVPVFHIFGMAASIVPAVEAGAKMVLLEEYKALKALRLVEEEKITVHQGVPTMFILELNHPEFADMDLSSLRTGIIAAAPCPEEIVKKIRIEMGCNIVVAYGSTETSSTLTVTSLVDDDIIRSQTVGKPTSGSEVKIIDANRKEMPTGEIGEIICRSPGVMKGYFEMPEKTSEAIDSDGWFYTGDLGTIDDQGNLRIVGRKKELIIRGGYNIYPREVEELLYQHHSVLEVAIIGLPDTVMGEVACAAIKLKPGKEETEESIREFIEDRIANYKVPDRFIFLDELPMTPSGKIKKLALQEELKAKLHSTLR
ncbi:class I adenylate-forming enzyme family protein [Peribacillus butanolivorans]|uniref:class I adenylate-forming enzyme family protein n=1 Tax=Peribacillus butanolivorans TaxID=421767 RepID=UPI003649F544